MTNTFNKVFNFDEVIHTDEDTLTVRGYANRYVDNTGKVVIDDHGTTFVNMQYDMSTYLKHPILYYAHDLDNPVGRVTKLEMRSEGLYVEAVVYKSINPRVYAMVKNKVVTSFSFGVIITDYEWSDILNATVVTKGELFDISLVTIPSNLESDIETIDMCSLGQCTAIRKKVVGVTDKSKVDEAIVRAMTIKLTKPLIEAQAADVTKKLLNPLQ